MLNTDEHVHRLQRMLEMIERRLGRDAKAACETFYAAGKVDGGLDVLEAVVGGGPSSGKEEIHRLQEDSESACDRWLGVRDDERN